MDDPKRDLAGRLDDVELLLERVVWTLQDMRAILETLPPGKAEDVLDRIQKARGH
jgi:hypothetical protein